MKRYILLSSFILGILISAAGQNYSKLTATDAVTGKVFELGNMVNGKGIVLIFHSLTCPFAKMYEGRIKAIHSNYQNQGFAFALINPEVGNSEADQLSLKNYIDQIGLNMSYLIDSGQVWTKLFEASKIPEVVVLIPGATGLEIKYRGAIDNNPQAETAVSERHLEKALSQILKGELPLAQQVRPVGCNIRTY
jgi:hypothetical protein